MSECIQTTFHDLTVSLPSVPPCLEQTKYQVFLLYASLLGADEQMQKPESPTDAIDKRAKHVFNPAVARERTTRFCSDSAEAPCTIL